MLHTSCAGRSRFQRHSQSSNKKQAWTLGHLLWHCYHFDHKSILTSIFCWNISLSAASPIWHTRTDRCSGFTSASTYTASHYTSYSSANYSSVLECRQNAICLRTVIKTNTAVWRNSVPNGIMRRSCTLSTHILLNIYILYITYNIQLFYYMNILTKRHISPSPALFVIYALYIIWH